MGTERDPLPPDSVPATDGDDIRGSAPAHGSSPGHRERPHVRGIPPDSGFTCSMLLFTSNGYNKLYTHKPIIFMLYALILVSYVCSRKVMFYVMMHSTHFIYCYMVSGIW